MNRALCLLLALCGGLLAGFAMACGVAVVGMGVLWLFVFGDDPWPGWVEPTMNIVVVVVGLGTTLLTIWLLFDRMRRGGRGEGD